MARLAILQLEDFLALFRDGAWPMLGLIAAALLLTGFAIIAAPRATTRRGRVLTILPAALLTVGATATLVTAIAAARDGHVRWVVEGPSHTCSCFGPPPIVHEHIALWLLPLLLVLAVPGVLAAVARAWRHPLVTAIAALASGVSIGGALVVAHLRAEIHNLRYNGPTPRYTLAELSSAIDLAPYVILALTTIALLALLAHRARTTIPLTRTNAAPIVAFVMFALGASAFAATRGHAADRRHPAPLTSSRWAMMHSAPIVPRTPAKLADDRCGELEIAPMLEVRADGSRLDGRRYETAEALARDLETTRRNWEVLHPRLPFHGAVHLYVAPDAPRARLDAVLAASAAAGYERPRYVQARRRLVPTHTLGDLAVDEVCVLDPADEKR